MHFSGIFVGNNGRGGFINGPILGAFISGGGLFPINNRKGSKFRHEYTQGFPMGAFLA
jgi:hypothetical protein